MLSDDISEKEVKPEAQKAFCSRFIVRVFDGKQAQKVYFDNVVSCFLHRSKLGGIFLSALCPVTAFLKKKKKESERKIARTEIVARQAGQG